MNPEIVKRQIAALRIAHPELVEDEEAWLMSLESETDLWTMLRAIERKRQEAECMAEAIGLNIDAMSIRGARFVRRNEACRDLIFKLMQAADLRKTELPEATLSIASGKPKVLITDETMLPPDCWRIKREPNKTKIAELIERDVAVPGATLSNVEPYLAIRTK